MSLLPVARIPNILKLNRVTVQPVRTYLTRRVKHNYTIEHKVDPVVEPPPGVNAVVFNRNPRNLERLAIAYKNDGWTMDMPGKTYWHKLDIAESRFGVKVSCTHQNGKVVMSAASDEWCIRKFLYKSTDKNAYLNVARIFARRCLQSGLNEMTNFYNFSSGGKLAMLVEEIENEGISLKEPIQMVVQNYLTKVKPLRPWDIVE